MVAESHGYVQRDIIEVATFLLVTPGDLLLLMLMKRNLLYGLVQLPARQLS